MSQHPADPFQTKTDIAARLSSGDLAPKKRFGQNFLIDRNLMHKLIDAAELTPRDCVLEVGAGTGSLTGLLADRAAHVVTSEIDKDLLVHLAGQFGERPNVTLVPGDCLQNKSTLAPKLVAAVRDALSRSPGPLKLVANLPYDVATPLVIDLLVSDLPQQRLCFTVQAEVADRFLAAPSTKDYGPVGIIAQALTAGRRIAKLPPQAFWPAPKVHSTMMRLDVRPAEETGVLDSSAFAAFVRALFQHRRKTLANNARCLSHPDRLLETLGPLGLLPSARPETIAVDQWVQIWRQYGGAS